MALVSSIALLVAVGIFALISTAFGHRLLHIALFGFTSDAEHLLCSVAVGVVCIEALFFLVEIQNHIRVGVVMVLGLALLFGIADLWPVLKKVARVFQSAFSESASDKVLMALTSLVLLIEGLAAMAPLSGSDALHYHFTAPLLVLQSGFHPNFFLSHSFFCGQSHLLILAGLALGSSRLAMGLLFLGGVLAAAASTCLARRLTNSTWAWIVTLSFLLTPVVFWQISSAGAPDLWMAFFAASGVLMISKSGNEKSLVHAILTGAFAGAVAGTKYTGCVVAVSMLVAYLWETRSVTKAFAFVLGALSAGVWPYARNLAWTGDPVFPFLLRWISPEKVNAYTLASYLADTGAGEHRSFWDVLRSPLFAGFDPSHLGFWSYFGPLVLTFVPLLLLAVRNTPVWRAAVTVWVLSALGIGMTSGGTRFLLPVFPIALAAVLAGVAQLNTIEWRAACLVSTATLGSFLLFGGGGLLMYEHPALSAATGIASERDYLRARAPEYEKAEFINQVLSGKEAEGKTLVFMRHMFYLRVPFLYGDPAASWAVDPSKLQTPEEWQVLLKAQGIRWVVRSPKYPATIAAPLMQLEVRGKLSPIARTEISDFQGARLYGQRETLAVTILRVND